MIYENLRMFIPTMVTSNVKGKAGVWCDGCVVLFCCDEVLFETQCASHSIRHLYPCCFRISIALTNSPTYMPRFLPHPMQCNALRRCL